MIFQGGSGVVLASKVGSLLHMQCSSSCLRFALVDILDAIYPEVSISTRFVAILTQMFSVFRNGDERRKPCQTLF